MSSAGREPSQLRNSYRLAATGMLTGIALSISAAPDFGGVLTLACTAWLVWTVHRYGRLGPD